MTVTNALKEIRGQVHLARDLQGVIGGSSYLENRLLGQLLGLPRRASCWQVGTPLPGPHSIQSPASCPQASRPHYAGGHSVPRPFPHLVKQWLSGSSSFKCKPAICVWGCYQILGLINISAGPELKAPGLSGRVWLRDTSGFAPEKDKQRNMKKIAFHIMSSSM